MHFVLSLDLRLKDEAAFLKKNKSLSPSPAARILPLPKNTLSARPLVVGAGPAGLFAALTLARAGARPLLIERGKPVDQRSRDVDRMAADGLLDEESNVQFGEGGAGAFSDGKLTCGVKSPYLRPVLDTLVAHGAPPDILIDQKPHIGTDRLKEVVVSIRREIIALGGAVCFETRLDRLLLHGHQVVGAVVSTPCAAKKCRPLKHMPPDRRIRAAIPFAGLPGKSAPIPCCSAWAIPPGIRCISCSPRACSCSPSPLPWACGSSIPAP